jgi:hypothetical protein
MAEKIEYPHLCLREWPFQTVPSPTFYKIWAGRSEIKERLNDMFRRVQQRKPSTIYLLWGYFGAGKTHSLRYFQWKLTNDKKNPTLVGYHEFLVSAKRFIDIYQRFIKEIDFREIERIARLVYEDFQQQYGEDAYQFFNKEISRYNDDFTNAVAALATGSEKSTIRSWMRAEKVYLRDLKQINIEKRIERDEDVFDFFSCLVRLLTYKCGELPTYRCVIWMVDDFHRIENLRRDYKNVISYGLNEIFDNCPERFCLVLAFTSRTVSAIKGFLSEALIERLPLAPYVTVPAMSKKEAIEFVIDLLKQFRPKEGAPDDCYPFSRETIDDVIDFTEKRGVLLPRNVMLSFDLVLNEGEELIKKGELERISSSFALGVLKTTEIL